MTNSARHSLWASSPAKFAAGPIDAKQAARIGGRCVLVEPSGRGEVAARVIGDAFAPPTQHNQPRYAGIDALRGIAAAHVVLYHFTWIYQSLFGFPSPRPVLIPFGIVAVYLFFIISGFVILMTAERVSNSWDFLLARAVRLYPVYWVCLPIAFIIPWIADLASYHCSLARLAVNVTMFQYLVGVGNVDEPYWSLGIELCFYLWVAGLLAVRKLRLLPHVMIALMCVGAMMQGIAYFLPGRDVMSPFALKIVDRMLLGGYIHYFAAGTALRLIASGRRRVGATLATSAFAYACVVCSPTDLGVAVGLFGAVVGAILWQPRWLTNRVFLFLGTISYPLYLVHNRVGHAIIHWLISIGADPSHAVLAAIGIVLGIATAVSYGVERPALRWAKRRRAFVDRRPIGRPSFGREVGLSDRLPAFVRS